MSNAKKAWCSELRRLHDEALSRNWETHLRDLNARLGLTGEYVLSTTDANLPPEWFNGDLEAIEPDRWVLVVSLNPKKSKSGYFGDELRRDNGWEFSHTYLASKWWHGPFFRPLAKLAAIAMNEPLSAKGEQGFSAKRMVFVELCPYASLRFGLSVDDLVRLSAHDPGFEISEKFRQILIEQARPALVLINGSAAVRDMDMLEGNRLDWHERRYTSTIGMYRGKPKRLWHKQGVFKTDSGAVPIVGFPFLKKPSTHNSNAEIIALGGEILAWRELLATEADKTSAPVPRLTG